MNSKEAFTAPDLPDNSQSKNDQSSPNASSTADFNSILYGQGSTYPNNSSAGADLASGMALKPVSYRCGDCNAPVTLTNSDAIRCKECGYRVLYKERTGRVVQFEAR